MNRSLPLRTVATFFLLFVGFQAAMLGAETTDKTFTIVFPKQQDNGKKVEFDATECWVTFEETVPALINYPPKQAFEKFAKRSTEFLTGPGKGVRVGKLQVYFFEGELAPGKSIEFKGRLINGKNYIVDKIEFGAFDKKGKYQSVIVSTKTNPKAFKLSDLGFTNHEYFDLSNPNYGTFTLINDQAGNGSSSFEYTLQNFRIYTNLPEANYDLSDFDNVGNAVPVYANPSLVIGPNQTVIIPLGQVVLPGQGYAVAIADQTTVTELDTGAQTTAIGLATGADGTRQEPGTTFNVAVSDPVYDASNQVWDVPVTLTNVSGTAVDGPFTLLITGLHSDILLQNATGIVGPGPYVELSGVPSLAAGSSVSVTLQLSHPDGFSIAPLPLVFSGLFH